MSKVHFEKIALIGIGLIGGSIALEARKRGLARSIVAATRSAETAATANRLKLAEHCGTEFNIFCHKQTNCDSTSNTATKEVPENWSQFDGIKVNCGEDE